MKSDNSSIRDALTQADSACESSSGDGHSPNIVAGDGHSAEITLRNTITRHNMTPADLLLYAVTDRHWLQANETLPNVVRAALEGGATFVQLREKNLDDATFLEEAKELKALCREYHVPFVINDNVQIALEMDADGVHVGQSDMEAGNVRELLGEDKIIGVSAGTVQEALRAEARGADYLGVGAVFPTGSKDDAKPVTHEMLRAITEAVHIPVVAIGGITEENTPTLAGSGIDGIAVISAIFGQKDIPEATKRLRKVTEAMVASRHSSR